jgi:hypothetical protein
VAELQAKRAASEAWSAGGTLAAEPHEASEARSEAQPSEAWVAAGRPAAGTHKGRMRRALASCALLAALGACSTAFAPAEVAPLERGSAAREPLPDEAELAAARIAAACMAQSGRACASPWLEELREIDARRAQDGLPPTHLLDDVTDLVSSGSGPEAYLSHARRMLDDGQPDAALRRKLERYVETRPLEVARKRLREDRTVRFGGLFNRLSGPLGSIATGQPLAAIESGRAAILALLVASSSPEVSTRQRQALRAYREFIERNPRAPEAAEVRADAERLQTRLDSQRVREARDVALKALAARRPDAALIHLERAGRVQADDPETAALRARAESEQAARDLNVERSLRSVPPEDRFSATAGREIEERAEKALASRVLLAPLADLPSVTAEWSSQNGDPAGTRDELEFIGALGRLAGGDEDGFFEVMRAQSARDPNASNMGRHARTLADRDPYRIYRAARSESSRRTAVSVLLGPLAESRMPSVPRALLPVAWLVQLPAYPVAIATAPLRVLQIPSTRSKFSGPVLNAGEEYLQQFPKGTHAEEVHARLEAAYAARSQWSQALVHHRARRAPDPERIASYREKVAERTLEAARSPRRIDVRVALYRSLIEEYADTPAGRTANEELRELRRTFTPQSIQISRAFLLEHPELTAPGALGLRAELTDGDDDNGELASAGVLLIGRTLVRIAIEDRDPVQQDLGPEAFARFIGLLEQAYESSLAEEKKLKPISDPQRDLFFERARLGLLDDTDLRAAAASSFAFLSRSERLNALRRGESILPVELVVRGGLEDFGVAAMPRIRMPDETEDAFLYK